MVSSHMWVVATVLDRAVQRIRDIASPLGNAGVEALAQCLASRNVSPILPLPSVPMMVHSSLKWPWALYLLKRSISHLLHTSLPESTGGRGRGAPSPHHLLKPPPPLAYSAYHLLHRVPVICSYSLQSILHRAAGRWLFCFKMLVKIW